MNYYEKTFDRLKKSGEIAFIPFWMIGDPDIKQSEKIIEILAKKADILELGIPFSDPLADGPTIQASVNRALEAGTTTKQCLGVVKNLRQKFPEKPIGLLVYFNLILSFGIADFFKEASKSGVNSVLIPEVPIEEVVLIESPAKEHNIELIFLVSTNTPEDRVDKIIEKAGGFIYAVSTPSITGAKADISETTMRMVQRLKSKTELPIVVGFGISSPEHIKELKENKADGAIIGSKLFTFRDDLEALESFCQACKNET